MLEKAKQECDAMYSKIAELLENCEELWGILARIITWERTYGKVYLGIWITLGYAKKLSGGGWGEACIGYCGNARHA